MFFLELISYKYPRIYCSTSKALKNRQRPFIIAILNLDPLFYREIYISGGWVTNNEKFEAFLL